MKLRSLPPSGRGSRTQTVEVAFLNAVAPVQRRQGTLSVGTLGRLQGGGAITLSFKRVGEMTSVWKRAWKEVGRWEAIKSFDEIGIF